MLELIPPLVPLLLVDVLNPVLFALLIVAIGTDRPIAMSTAFLVGHTTAYFASGVAIALALEKVTSRLDNPLPVDFVIELLLGVFLVWAALQSRGGKASEEKTPGKELTPAYCFGYGAVINFIGVPFALPYFAVVDQTLKANLSVESTLLVLALYNIAYALPFTLVPALRALLGESVVPLLKRVNELLARGVDVLLPPLLFLCGVALGVDAIAVLCCGIQIW